MVFRRAGVWTSSSKSSMWTFSTLVIMNAYRKRARDSLPDYTVTSTQTVYWKLLQKIKLFLKRMADVNSWILVICVTLSHITQLLGHVIIKTIPCQQKTTSFKNQLKTYTNVIMDTKELSKVFWIEFLISWVSMVKKTQCENRVKLMVFMKSHHISVSGKK